MSISSHGSSPVCAAGARQAGELPSAAVSLKPSPATRGEQHTPEGAAQRAAAPRGRFAVEGHISRYPVEVGR